MAPGVDLNPAGTVSFLSTTVAALGARNLLQPAAHFRIREKFVNLVRKAVRA